MKVVVYNVRPYENEFLARANNKKHDITLISNTLNADTIMYAAGKNAVIVTEADEVSAVILERLAALGVKYLIARSVETKNINKEAAFNLCIKIANLPFYSPLQKNMQANADEVIRSLDLWEINKCVGEACICAKDCGTVKNKATK